MTRPEDFNRLAKANNVAIDFSPVLSYPAPEIEGSMAPPIGEERYHRFFNVRSAIESGVPVGFGSDWPSALIPDPNAFHQMQSWITRRDPATPEDPTLKHRAGDHPGAKRVGEAATTYAATTLPAFTRC
jgi:predicted amidohydrolase YtcJ